MKSMSERSQRPPAESRPRGRPAAAHRQGLRGRNSTPLSGEARGSFLARARGAGELARGPGYSDPRHTTSHVSRGACCAALRPIFFIALGTSVSRPRREAPIVGAPSPRSYQLTVRRPARQHSPGTNSEVNDAFSKFGRKRQRASCFCPFFVTFSFCQREFYSKVTFSEGFAQQRLFPYKSEISRSLL